MQLLPVAVDYSKGQSLDGTPLTFVRMRVIVDPSSAQTGGLWAENDAATALADNEITTKSLTIRDGIAVAIIDTATTDLSQFSEYEPGTDEICIRTFITIMDLFGRDDCWDTVRIGPKSCNEWYKIVLEVSG